MAATSGSTLMNNVSAVPKPASMAVSMAVARQIQSSSWTRPRSRAVPKSRSGRSIGVPAGPRARASNAMVSPVERSTIGW